MKTKNREDDNMRIVFIAGLKEGYECVKSVIEDGWNVIGIFTLSEKFKDRSGYVSFDPLNRYRIPIYKVEDINEKNNIKKIKELNPDVIVVIGWSFIVCDEIVNIPKLGCIGNHPTLLPKHRGNAPIPWAIIMGLTKSGTTWFHFVKDVDAGDIIGQREFEIDFEDTAENVYNKALDATIDLLKEILPKLRYGTALRLAQDHKRANIMPKRQPQDGIIDWNKMQIFQYNGIRGLSHPYPGAFTYLNEDKIYIWRAMFLENNEYEGRSYYTKIGGKILDIVDKGLIVSTGDGAILLTRLQKEGDEELDGCEFAKLYKIKVGTVFG
jgi:methionyl-tRNA formyltransferase